MMIKDAEDDEETIEASCEKLMNQTRSAKNCLTRRMWKCFSRLFVEIKGRLRERGRERKVKNATKIFKEMRHLTEEKIANEPGNDLRSRVETNDSARKAKNDEQIVIYYDKFATKLLESVSQNKSIIFV
jgi:hypothetical protein